MLLQFKKIVISGFVLFFYIDISKWEIIESSTTNLAAYRSSCCNVDIVLEISNQYKLHIYLALISTILFQTKLSVNSIVYYKLKLLAF